MRERIEDNVHQAQIYNNLREDIDQFRYTDI